MNSSSRYPSSSSSPFGMGDRREPSSARMGPGNSASAGGNFREREMSNITSSSEERDWGAARGGKFAPSPIPNLTGDRKSFGLGDRKVSTGGEELRDWRAKAAPISRELWKDSLDMIMTHDHTQLPFQNHLHREQLHHLPQHRLLQSSANDCSSPREVSLLPHHLLAVNLHLYHLRLASRVHSEQLPLWILCL